MNDHDTILRRKAAYAVAPIAVAAAAMALVSASCGGGGDGESAAAGERAGETRPAADDPARIAAASICAEANKKLKAIGPWPAAPRRQASYLGRWRAATAGAVDGIAALEGPADDPTLFSRYAAHLGEPLRVAVRAQDYARAGDAGGVTDMTDRLALQLEDVRVVASSDAVKGCEWFPYSPWVD